MFPLQLLQLDLDEMTVENALSKSFQKIIKYQLEPVWHQVKQSVKSFFLTLYFDRQNVLRAFS